MPLISSLENLRDFDAIPSTVYVRLLGRQSWLGSSIALILMYICIISLKMMHIYDFLFIAKCLTC